MVELSDRSRDQVKKNPDIKAYALRRMVNGLMLLNDTRRTRTEKLDSIIGNLEEYRVETKKKIIEQAIVEKKLAAYHQPGSSTEAPSGTADHIRESSAIASELRSRWDPGSEKPTIKSARGSTEVYGLPPSARATLAGKTIARLDAYDKQSASALEKFYQARERSRRDSAQWSAGGDAATPVVGNGDPRLIGRTPDYDASRDPRLRR